MHLTGLFFVYLTILLLPIDIHSQILRGYAAEQTASINGILRYSRDQLWQVREQCYCGNFPLDLPEECRRATKTPRKRGLWQTPALCPSNSRSCRLQRGTSQSTEKAVCCALPKRGSGSLLINLYLRLQDLVTL